MGLKNLNLSLQDIKKALSQHPIWLHLGLLEVKQRYRRSVLGPWWISISMLIFVAVMGVIFSRIFAQDLARYITFFTSGFLLWSFVSTCINESTDIFRINSGFIKQINLPYNLYILKFLTKNISFLAHNFVVYLLVICFFKVNPGWVSLLAIPGILLLIINMYWVSLFVALISTRFRDMVPIINSAVQIMFFITPISWMPKLLGESSIIVKLNPLVYLLDAARLPLQGIAPPPLTWIVDISIAILGLSLSFMAFNSVRSRIPFWID
ncbi:MAG: ABC transporter permease [Verrucomicrobia bacterium]|nr:ABC transporter permease [Verrucomicrobiota bacterium]